MSYTNLLNELDSLMDLIKSDQKKRERKIKSYFRQLKQEEQNIKKKLEVKKSKASRKKLKNKLGIVRQGYQVLEAA